MNKLEDLNLKNQLEENLKNSCGLRKYCLNHILEEYEEYEEIKNFFTDLFNGGCMSGMISDLIYYEDTNKFFDKYEEDIENLITLNMDMMGIETRPLFIESLNGSAESLREEKNLLSWFAFEETMRNLNEEFKINKDYL